MFAPIKRVENAHTDSIWSIAWTEGGKVITGSIDESVCVWEVPAASAEEEKKIEGDMKISLKETFGDHALGVISVAAQPTGKCECLGFFTVGISILDCNPTMPFTDRCCCQ